SSDTIRGTVADGHHIYLTVDEVIQHIVERELDLVMAKHNAKSALAVAMDPRTGEVLALAARPDFDPNKYASYPAEIWRNAVISDSYEPGSTFKIITAAAALNENIVNDADRFVDPGFILVAGIQLRCWKAGGHGSQTFEQAFWNSCNPAFVQLGQKLGAEAFARYVQGFGFGKKPLFLFLVRHRESCFQKWVRWSWVRLVLGRALR
ncbi:MAG: penicillin-binding transpeptidase domain-containing protein, partial [bacterium]|nr:penicillin-binding transpeptidase domain-containing protein [bacterium]